MTAASRYTIVGRIRRAQGVRGEVAIELLTENPERHFAPGASLIAGTVSGDVASAPGAQPREITVERARPFRGGLLVKLDAITDRTEADRWRGRYLLVPESEVTPLEPDEVFMHDLIGLRVIGADGRELGRVAAFYELPQGLTLEVVRTDGGTVLVPYLPRHVREVDLGAGTLSVDTDTGLFD